MKTYRINYTSTETLFDEEKQRTQSALTIRAKDEADAEEKALQQLIATNRHSHIVVHSVEAFKSPVKKPTRFLTIIVVILAVMVLLALLK